MSEYNFKTKEGHTLRSMMRRPEMAKIIKEAVNSPLGSTSRKKAQKLFKIVNRLNTAYDGMGGPGMQYQRMEAERQQWPEMDPVHVPTDNPKNVIIFHKIPQPKIVYGSRASKDKPRAGSFDGTGGPGIHDGQGGILGDAWGSVVNLFSTPFDQISTTSQSTPSYLPSQSSSTKPTTISAPTGQTSSGSEGWGTTAAKWVGNTALPAIGSGITSAVKNTIVPAAKAVGSTVLGAGQFLGQNALQAGADVINAATVLTNPFTPPSSLAKVPGPGYVSMGDTYGSKKLAEMMPSGSTTQAAQAPNKSVLSTSQYTNSPLMNAITGNKTSTQIPGWNSIKQVHGQSSVMPTGAPSVPGQTGNQSGSTLYEQILNGSNIAGSTQQNTAENLTNTGNTQNQGEKPYSTSNNTPSGGSNTASQTGDLWGLAAERWQSKLGGIDLTTPLKNIVETPQQMGSLIDAIIENEGVHSEDGKRILNNPGHIKFNNLPGQTDSGVQATDGGTFASYATMADGVMAIASIIKNAAAGNSSSYGPNPTLGSFANKYTNTGPGTEGTAGTMTEQIMNNALGRSLGPGMAADIASRALNGGLSEEEALALERKEIADKYDIAGKREQYYQLQKDHELLPAKAREYITQHDTFIKETDKQINKIVDDYTVGSSLPANRAAIQSQLSYLYTIRGRQNQSYVGFIKDAVAVHQQELDRSSHDLEVAINGFNEEIATRLPLTSARYERQYNALSGMYTELKNKEVEALQLEALKNQATAANSTSATDTLAFASKYGFTAQFDDIKKGSGLIDTDGYVTPGQYSEPLSLYQKMLEMKGTDPQFFTQNKIQAYLTGVSNYLNPNLSQDEKTKRGITAEKQEQVAKEAIIQLTSIANLAHPKDTSNLSPQEQELAQENIQLAALILGTGEKSPGSILGGGGKLDEMMAKYANIISSNFSPRAGKGLEAMNNLSPKWLGFINRSVPSEQDFVDSFTEATGDTRDESIARALYTNFKLLLDANPGATPEQVVKGMTYKDSSTQDRANPVQYTPIEFANYAGNLTAGLVYQTILREMSQQ